MNIDQVITPWVAATLPRNSVSNQHLAIVVTSSKLLRMFGQRFQVAWRLKVKCRRPDNKSVTRMYKILLRLLAKKYLFRQRRKRILYMRVTDLLLHRWHSKLSFHAIWDRCPNILNSLEEVTTMTTWWLLTEFRGKIGRTPWCDYLRSSNQSVS